MSILHIAAKLVNNPTETQPYCIDVNDVFQITNESVKLMLNMEYFGTGSDLVISTRGSTVGILFHFLAH